MTRTADQALDVFIDLTGEDERARRRPGALPWPQADRFTASARRVVCVVHPDLQAAIAKTAAPLAWTLVASTSAIAACSEAMRRASAGNASLLVLHGRLDVSGEAVSVMRRTLDQDPMFGSVAARVRCPAGCCVRRPARGLAVGSWVPRRTLADTPDVEICPEVFESALLFPPDVVAEFGALDERFATMPGAILHYLSLARRCGYRTVLNNRAVLTSCGRGCDEAPVRPSTATGRDESLLRQVNPDLDRGWEEFRAAGHERFEHLSAHVHRAAAGGERRAVLLDIRNVGTLHNGTSHAVLGCTDALHRLSPPLDVTVLARPSAMQFHRRENAWPGWTLTTTMPARPFAAALRLSQPWHIQEMADLHRAALFNLYFVLDTISWDVVYPPPRRLDGTWSFLADHADGLLFDSAFTERRFLARFGRAADVPRSVCHYPFSPADYLDSHARDGGTSDAILVIGNDLDHKDAVRTIELLSRAFPFRPLVSLGPKLTETPYLRAYRSGSLSDRDVSRLYSEAKFVVFPSFYEGFAFPIVTALAHGKTILARRSDLLDEITARCSTGRLIAFTRRDELVGILGRLLHGEPVQEEPIGTVVSDVSRRWCDVAADLVAFLDRVTSQPARSRWRQREHAVNQILAFRS
jgi:glycosyltransferase involved in cell wall biosynthesis